jgi:hypothetical protein
MRQRHLTTTQQATSMMCDTPVNTYNTKYGHCDEELHSNTVKRTTLRKSNKIQTRWIDYSECRMQRDRSKSSNEAEHNCNVQSIKPSATKSKTKRWNVRA